MSCFYIPCDLLCAVHSSVAHPPPPTSLIYQRKAKNPGLVLVCFKRIPRSSPARRSEAAKRKSISEHKFTPTTSHYSSLHRYCPIIKVFTNYVDVIHLARPQEPKIYFLVYLLHFSLIPTHVLVLGVGVVAITLHTIQYIIEIDWILIDLCVFVFYNTLKHFKC